MKHKLIYASSYDRGLQHLLKMWPQIIKKYPDTTLDIYYGWNLFETVFRKNPERMDWMDRMKKLMKQKGITHHGRVGQDELKKARLQSTIWVYPTDFCVTGDTLVDMPRDYTKCPLGVPIKDLVGKQPVVWTFNEKTQTFELKKVEWVKKTRKHVKIVRVNWNDGTFLRCTPDHKVLTYTRGWVEAQNLKKGESVRALKKHMKVQVSVGKSRWPLEHREIARFKFGEIPKGYHVDHIDGNPFNNSIDNLQILSPSEHAKKTFNDVVLTEKQRNAVRGGWLKWANSPEGKRQMSRLASKRSKDFWDSMSDEERERFIKNRAKKTKRAYNKWWKSLLDEKKQTWEDSGRSSRWNHKCLSVKDDGYADVYDMLVEDNHNFVAGGVVVHNCEINCITALEMAREGAVPCVINRAALKETVGSGIRVEGDIFDPEVREEYLKQLLNLMEDDELWKKERKKGKEFATSFDWDIIASKWNDVFKKA